MPYSRLHPNSPRKRIEYVFKNLDRKVARDTASVVAHTVGAAPVDGSSIEGPNDKDFQNKVDHALIQSFPDGPPHPAEALIAWVGQRLAAQQKEVRKGRLSAREYDDLVEDLERMLPHIATWVHHARPDLTKLSIADAMRQAAVFEDPGASSDVPQGEVIYRFDDGWTIQNLTTEEQIFADGIHVQNCLKKERYGPSYASAVKAGKTKIFSLRKPSGIPVISIEYDVPYKSFEQIYAKQNTPLGIRLEDLLKELTWRERPDEARILWENIQQYKPRIAEFLTAFGADGAAFIKADAPLPADVTEVGGTLDLRSYKHPLPVGLTRVRGNLRLEGYPHPLPAGFTSVGGSLSLEGYQHPLPAGLTRVGALDLRGYKHPLPAGFTSVGGTLDLTDYAHPLPAGLTRVGGLFLKAYNHPLPAGLTSVGGLYPSDYPHPLPAGLTRVGVHLDLSEYSHPLPKGLTSVGGDLTLRGYPHPLPAGFTSVGGTLDLTDYAHPLPAGLTRVGGNLKVGSLVIGSDLYLRSYPHPLPARLTSVEGTFDLRSYKHPLPAGIISAGGFSGLHGYPHPLPAGLTSVRGTLDLRGYEHPLPAGLTRVGNALDLRGYPHPLPASLTHVGGEVAGADEYRHSLAQLGIGGRQWRAPSARVRLRENPRRTSRKPPRKTSRKPVRKTSKRTKRKTSRSRT